MPTKPAQGLRFEATEDLAYLNDKAMNIFIDDVFQKNLPVPFPEPTPFAKVAKTRDGRVMGGIIGLAQWNHLEIYQVAVQPEFQLRGVGTALMKCAEETTRTTFVGNRLLLAVYDWQPRAFFEKLGYEMLWTLDNHPRGHCQHHMQKTWPLAWRDEAVTGYAGAATDLVIEDWDSAEAAAQLAKWLHEDAVQKNVGDLPPLTDTLYGFKALHPDGALAGVCIYLVHWNMMYVHMLTVVKGQKRRGVGTAMLREIDEEARRRGCDHVVLHTMVWQARPFYEKNGFKLVATHKDLPFTFERYVLHHRVSPNAPSKL